MILVLCQKNITKEEWLLNKTLIHTHTLLSIFLLNFGFLKFTMGKCTLVDK